MKLDRDPTKVLNILRQHSEYLKQTDQRLGQFIMNAVKASGHDDPFYMENDALADAIRQYIVWMQK